MRIKEPGARSQEPERGPTGARRLRFAGLVLTTGFWLLAPGSFCLTPGCSKSQPTTRPTTLRERQDDALRDPFGYSPDMGTTDISGGGLSDFDRGSFGKDMKNVFDP